MFAFNALHFPFVLAPKLPIASCLRASCSHAACSAVRDTVDRTSRVDSSCASSTRWHRSRTLLFLPLVSSLHALIPVFLLPLLSAIVWRWHDCNSMISTSTLL